MRATLLTVTIMMAVPASRLFALESFNCFDTPIGEHKCACIGVAGCKEMQQSGNCKSELVCDQDQLGAIVCSCNAGRISRPTSLNYDGSEFRPAGLRNLARTKRSLYRKHFG